VSCEIKNIHKITIAAEKTRNELEKYAAKNMHIGNPITLECFCAIGAYTLWNVYKKLGFSSAEFIAGEFIDYNGTFSYHCWNIIETKIVDITATQFKFIYDRVYVPNLQKQEFYVKSGYFYKNSHATKKINEEWEESQNIKNNKEGIVKMISNSLKEIKKEE